MCGIMKRSQTTRITMVWLVVVAVVWLLPNAPASAYADDRSEKVANLEEILDGLEHGIVALEKLGRHEELKRLQGIANDVRGELQAARRQRGGAERELLINQLELLQLARPALAEAGRGDAEELIQRAIRARETVLEGRRDEEAQAIRARSPRDEQIVKCLAMAEDAYREFGMAEKARIVSRNNETLFSRRDRPQARRESQERSGQANRERREGARRIEVMRTAMHALLEAERIDAAHLIEHAIHARELALEGRRDEEAMHIRETAPKLAEQAELLMLAAELWADFGHEKKAAAVSELARQMHRKLERTQARDTPNAAPERPARRGPNREVLTHQIEIMQMAMPALREAGREDTAELLKRAIQVRTVNLKGLQGEEANMVRERAPKLGQVVEILRYAADLWTRFGDEEKAAVIDRLANQMWENRDRPRTERKPAVRRDTDGAGRVDREERAGRGAPTQHEATMRRIEMLEGKLEEFERQLHEMQQALKAINRERR